MAFGKGKRVGMKRAKKMTVPEAETVAARVKGMEEVAPAEERAPRRKSAKLETPPMSPVKARVPPSPNKIRLNAFAAVASEFKMQAVVAAMVLREEEKKHLVKERLYDAKMNKISKLGSRKLNPITPRQELNRLWKAETAFLMDVLKLHIMKWHVAQKAERAKDAQIDLLQEKLRRMSLQCRRSKGKRSGVLGSPIARFKCMSRKCL